MKRPAKIILFLGLLAVTACTANQEAPVLSAPPRTTELSFDNQGRGVRPRGERNWDDAVGQRALAMLNQADKAAFKGVSVRAWDGAILLTGAVAKPELRRRAEEIAKSVDGVTQVHDELVLAENPGLTTYVPDAYREQRIYAGLLGNDAVTGAYSVRVVNGVAYLLGTSRSAADVAKAADFAREFEGIKWVVERVSVR